MEHINISIDGLVQGVRFRLTSKAVADHLRIKGIVKNMPDGSVYIEAEGKRPQLELFLEWCREGPDNAKVEKVTTVDGELKNYRNFDIVRK